MFTGIVEEIGTVRCLQEIDGGWHLRIQAQTVLAGTQLGDSIAINGTCLTVTELSANEFCVGLSPETLRCTNLGSLDSGDGVNLERSLTPHSRMGGHFVQGHIEGTGKIIRRTVEGDSLWLEIETSPHLLRYIVPKGFIAVDGTSLTVCDVTEHSFTFMLIAYTQEHVILPRKALGELVNLETDILSKYVERILAAQTNPRAG